MIDILIDGCEVVNSTGRQLGWIAIADGVIVAVGSNTGDKPSARRVIPADGLTALPGRIDPHIHIGIHGADMSDDIERVSRLAAAGGATTLMPLNRAKRSYHELMPIWTDAVRSRATTDFLFHLQMQIPDHIVEIPEYRDRYGTACFKLHFDYRTSNTMLTPMDIAHVDDGDLYLTMEQVARYGGVVAVHCENTHVAARTAERVRASGRNDLLAWGDAKPPICEALDVELVGTMATALGCRAIAVHLSSKLGLEAASRFPRNVLTVETIVGFLTMTLQEAHERVGFAAKGNPPFRTAADRDALWEGVESGLVSTIGTDNVLRETAAGPTVWETGVGHCTMEFALPLLLTYGVFSGRVPLERLVEATCDAPARLYGIADRKRGIRPGGDADIVLVDMEERRVVAPASNRMGFRTIVDGLELRGWPRLTMLRGQVTFDGSDVIPSPGLAQPLASTL